MNEIQNQLFKIINIQSVFSTENGIRIIYQGGSFEDKTMAQLNTFEKQKVLFINDLGGGYSEWGILPNDKEVVYLDQSRVKLQAYQATDIKKAQESKDNTYFKKLLVDSFDTQYVSKPDLDGSWLRANYQFVNEKLNEADRFINVVGASETQRLELRNKILGSLTSSQLKEYQDEQNRRYLLNQTDNTLSFVVLNPALFVSDWSFKNPEQAAAGAALLVTGVGALESLAASQASLAIPTVEQLGQAGAVAILDQGKKIVEQQIKNVVSQNQISEAQVMQEQYVSQNKSNFILPIIAIVSIIGLAVI